MGIYINGKRVSPAFGVTPTVVNITDGTISLAYNTIFNGAELSNLVIELPTTDAKFICQLNFTSGETATAFTAPDTIKWSGDDITDGALVPVVNKRYVVMFYSDGESVRAISQGA